MGYLEPASKLAAVRWAQERVAIGGCPTFDDDAAHAAMDFLLDALPEIAERIFASTANLLNLSCDIIFVDTSSTYFERDVADGEADLDLAEGMMEPSAPENGSDASGPVERATAGSTSIPRTTGPTFPDGHPLRASGLCPAG